MPANADATIHLIAVSAMKLRFAKAGGGSGPLYERGIEVAEETLLRAMVTAYESGVPWLTAHRAKDMGASLLYVKIGTHTPSYYMQVKRSPYTWASVVRGLPSIGDMFAIIEPEGSRPSVLRCVDVKRGMCLLYAERA